VFIGIIKYNKLFSTNDAMKAVTNYLRKIRGHIYTFFLSKQLKRGYIKIRV
jgi:hypothetical protein